MNSYMVINRYRSYIIGSVGRQRGCIGRARPAASPRPVRRPALCGTCDGTHKALVSWHLLFNHDKRKHFTVNIIVGKL